MNNLAIILEQVLEARKMATEQAVVEKLDEVIQTIVDMMKAEPKSGLPPINYHVPIPAPPDDSRFDSIWRTPIGGYRILCGVDMGTPVETATVTDRAKELARETLGWQ